MDARSRTGLWLGALALLIGLVWIVAGRSRDEAGADSRTTRASNKNQVWRGHQKLPTPPALPQIHAGGLRLEGQVVDGEERPIAGAKVTLERQRVATSEADGSFAFDNLSAGDYSVTAETAGMYGEEHGAKLTATSDPVSVKMRRGASLRVQVIAAETGAPIADASVETFDRKQLTDSAGYATLRAIDPGLEFVRVLAQGRASQKLTVTTDDPLVTLERSVRLARGAAVGGLVLDPSGAPITDAHVRVSSAGDVWSDSARTDSQGRWSVPSFGPGKHSVVASAERYIDGTEQIFEHDGVNPRSDVTLKLEVGGEIAGFVVDAAGQPVAGARVHTNRSAEDSDANGHFSLAGLAKGEYEVYAVSKLGISTTTKIKITGKQRVDLTLAISASSLAGIVVDSHGQPIERAIVGAKSGDYNTYTRTDEFGRFDFGGIVPGDYEVSAQRDAEVSRDLPRGIAVKTTSRSIRIELPDLSTISGRVVLDGKPVPFFGFTVTSTPTSSWLDRPQIVRGDDGKFTQRDMAPGTWAIVVAGPGFARHVVPDIQVTAGASIQLGDIRVSRGRTLSGRVTDERGAAVPDALVSVFERKPDLEDGPLRLAMQGSAIAKTDAAGRYQIIGIDPAKTDLHVEVLHTTRGVTTQRDLAAGETTANFVIRAAGGIDGMVTNNSGRSFMAIAQSTTERDISFRASIDAGGVFQLDQVPAGSYHVRLAGGVKTASQRIDVVAGKRTTVAFVLPIDPITLTVRSAACSMVSLKSTRADGTDDTVEMESCENGVSILKDLAPGHYDLCSDFSNCRAIDIPSSPVNQTINF